MTTPIPNIPQLGEYVWNVGTQLRDCLCTKLTETIAGEPCRCSIIPGELAIMDFCGKTPEGEGMAWVRLVQMYESQNFPQPIENGRCNTGFQVAEYELGVLRCAAPLTSDGKAPSAQALQADAAKVWDDAAALQWVAGCCLPAGLPTLRSNWQPVSGGGCTGGRLTLLVHLIPGPISNIRNARSVT